MLCSPGKVRSFKAGCCPWYEAPLVHVPPPPPTEKGEELLHTTTASLLRLFWALAALAWGTSSTWSPLSNTAAAPMPEPMHLHRSSGRHADSQRQPVSIIQTVSTSGEGHATQAGTVAMAKTSTGEVVKNKKPSQPSRG